MIPIPTPSNSARLPRPGLPQGMRVVTEHIPYIPLVDPPVNRPVLAVNHAPPSGVVPMVLPTFAPPTVRSPSELSPPGRNPYIDLSYDIFSEIVRRRDVALTGSLTEQKEQLYLSDQIMLDDWIKSVLRANVNTLQVLDKWKLHVFAAIHELDADVDNTREMVSYLRAQMLMRESQDNPLIRMSLSALRPSTLRRLASPFLPEDCSIEIMTDVEIVDFIHRKHAFDLSRVRAATVRYRMLTSATYSRLILDLYGERTWREIAELTVIHPLETIILHLGSTFSPESVIEKLGIILPHNLEGSALRYLEDNLVEYQHILVRDRAPCNLRFSRWDMTRMSDNELTQVFWYLTDQELLMKCGVDVKHNSRTDLLEKLSALNWREGFFCPVDLTHACNSETMLGTSIKDTKDPLIAYGTLHKFRVYELDELAGSFHRNDETGAMTFRRPEDNGLTFDLADVRAMVDLVRLYPPSDEKDILLARVDEVMILLADLDDSEREFMQRLWQLPEKERALVQDFFRQLFFIGMHMRRWKGPGHPYPIRNHETMSSTWNDEQVKTELAIGNDMLTNMRPYTRELVNNIYLCRYRKSEAPQRGNERLSYVWYRVGRGNYCIRMASVYLVSTGYYHLKTFFQEVIPDVDVTKLDSIS